MRISKRFSKTKFGQKCAGFVFYLITKLIFVSIKWKCIDEDNKFDILKNKSPYIFCCWHNRLFLGPHLLPRNRVINALQSSHSDGMITSVAFKYLGMNVILGSSMKGGMQAFRKMIKCINAGESIAITPDGPKGPKETVKEGMIKLAQITGAPIIPLVWSTDKYKEINSWDKFKIPLPFARGTYTFGNPIYVQKKISNTDFEILRLKVENEIKYLTKSLNNEIS